MKKALALLVAFAAVISINVTAFAADNADVAPAISWATGSLDTNPVVHVETNQIVLGFSSGGRMHVVRPETYLKPGNDYTYQLLRVTNATGDYHPDDVTTEAITDNLLASGKLRIRSVKGSANVTSAKIEKKGSGGGATHNFKIETKETYGVKTHDLEYTISVTGGSGILHEGNFTFETGYRAMTDDDIDSYGEGDIVTVMNDRPVILKKQFDTLAKANAYKAVEFTGEDGDWTFIGRVSGMGDANFTTTYDVVPEIINQFPEQDYKFITFNAGVTFPTNGELRIDVDDLTDDYLGTRLHAYLYRNGALTPINTTFDTTSDELVFRTNYLGAFLITNAEITGLEEPTTPAEPTTPPENDHNNPYTGASAMGAIVALGAASTLSAGAIIRRKKK